MKRKLLFCCVLGVATVVEAATVTVDVNIMPRVVFTGDSQTCGRSGALDYPQMLSWEMPARVLNTAVGGTNTKHLLEEMRGGTASVRKGERTVHGRNVSWHAGPYPGQRIRLGRREYTIDRIEVTRQRERRATIWIAEPAAEDFTGDDYSIEAGWRGRIAEQKPDYACFMYSVNDAGATSEEFRARLEEIAKRCRAIGAQPVFLSGFPLMDAAKGGSHPGDNRKVDTRANDLATFCAERGLPFGDVFHALMRLDEPLTCVWMDTVHPTTDGSTAALNALRSIFNDLGLTQNPYCVRGYRARGALEPPGNSLSPFTTSQPDYTAANKFNDNQFDLAAIKARDEYGLIAASDGHCVESDTPIVLRFGVGDAARLTAARAGVVVSDSAVVSWFDPKKQVWRELASGSGRIEAKLPANLHGSDVWIAIHANGKVVVDYAALTIEGDVAPFKPQRVLGPVVWPKPGDLEWHEKDNLPIGNWLNHGEHTVRLHTGVIAVGAGEFVAQKRVTLFRSDGQRFTQTVRPLDLLRIIEDPETVRGNYLISEVMDDQTLRVRRYPKSAATDLKFEIVRSSGCAVAPATDWLQCRSNSYWQTSVSGLTAGRYRFGFFYRAYDPANMNARRLPGNVACVTVNLGAGKLLATTGNLNTSYQWQRAWIEFDVQASGDVMVRAAAQSNTPVEFTGFVLNKH